MSPVSTTPLPESAFLNEYASQEGCYTDCFSACVSKDVSLTRFIAVFFKTPVFRLERVLLGVFARKPSTSQDVSDLAAGISEQMAVWRVEARAEDQLLLKVGTGPIRTWLMCECKSGETRLYFGSAVLPLETDKQGRPRMAFAFRASYGFHKVYSWILLSAAARALR
jgi:hypothetical protein